MQQRRMDDSWRMNMNNEFKDNNKESGKAIKL